MSVKWPRASLFTSTDSFQFEVNFVEKFNSLKIERDVKYLYLFILCFRLETTKLCFSLWKTRHITRVLRTKHLCGNNVWQTWMNTFTTWIRSRGSGFILNQSLVEVLFLKNKGGSRGLMMILGKDSFHFMSEWKKER